MDYLTLLKQDEGLRQTVYDDATGLEVKAPHGNLTIGYGINLQQGISEELASVLLDYVVNLSITVLKHDIECFAKLNDVRQAVLINMAYNLGIHGLMGFTTMLSNLAQERFTEAGMDLLDSKAARQLPARYSRLSKMLITGAWV
jgi:lysozyme